MHNCSFHFSKRYNKNIQRPVYYCKSNTCNDTALLLAAVLHKYNFTDWAYKTCKSRTHKHCIKVINTNTGNMLQTDYTF